MRDESVYVIPCDRCGETVESHEPKTVCPKCGMVLVVDGWGERMSASVVPDSLNSDGKMTIYLTPDYRTEYAVESVADMIVKFLRMGDDVVVIQNRRTMPLVPWGHGGS